MEHDGEETNQIGLESKLRNNLVQLDNELLPELSLVNDYRSDSSIKELESEDVRLPGHAEINSATATEVEAARMIITDFTECIRTAKDALCLSNV